MNTGASAAAGAIVWVVAFVAGLLGPIERAVALAALVVVPLGLSAVGEFDGHPDRFRRLAITLQPLGALAVLASVTVLDGPPAALAAACWLPVTLSLGVAGATRTLDARTRGFAPLAERVVDVGLAYLSVAAVALVMFHLDLTLWFAPVIILLTFVHFSFAGFALAVVTGLSGRVAPGSWYRPLALVVLGGPALIGIGISFSPLVEVLAVGVFTLGVTLLAGYLLVRVVPTRPRRQAVLLAVSALALPGSMVLALGYGLAAYTGSSPLGLPIGQMVAIHGSLNAFGFAVCGLVGWRLARPAASQTR
ncbi:YndJ family protein [Halorubellus salinus]|uniref:YndJ family protein n=1 Tax=Halorubellus salinus TaxID=755309 RepID=UPI001D06A514|nr:YndJ family protein [Halorubellus salinus]